MNMAQIKCNKCGDGPHGMKQMEVTLDMGCLGRGKCELMVK